MAMEFKTETLNEAVLDVPATNTGNRLESIIPDMMNVISQIHIWHLLCPSGQKHMALGELYESLQDEVDELAEIYIAMGGAIGTVGYFVADVKYSDMKVIEYLKGFVQTINEAIKNTTAAEQFSLNDELGDIQESIYHFIYKFNLS